MRPLLVLPRGRPRQAVRAGVGECLLDDLGVYQAGVREQGEGGDADPGGVDAEVHAQGLTCVGEPVAVGAERGERCADEPRDLIG